MNRAVLFLVGLSGLGVLVAGGMPAPTTDPQAAAPVKQFHSAPNAWSNDAVLDASQAGQWRGEVRLERQPDGQFYADIAVGGIPVRAVVDTGADVVALPGEDARRIGLTWSADEVRTIGRGASGEVRGVLRHVDSVNVHGIVVRDVAVMVIPTGLDVALLGQNVLGRISGVHLRGDTMVLSNL